MLEPQGQRPEFLFTAPADEDQSRILPCQARSAAAARRLVSAVLDRWELSALTDRAVLVVSELVTNAVVHAGPRTRSASIRVVVGRIGEARIRVAVTDFDATSLPHLEPAGPVQEHGRGLALVASLCECWGVTTRDWGKQMWAELACDRR